MKNLDQWQPTKFVPSKKGWRPSSDPKRLSPASRHTSARALSSYVAAIESYASGHLLDLGSGRAPLYGVYEPLVTQVTCADWSSSMHDTRHIDVLVDLNEPLPLPENSFDTVLSSSVLEHIWSHDTLWREISRVLRPGGHLILGTPFLYVIHEEPHDYFRWTPYALRRASEEAGLDLVELTAYGGPLDVLADLIAKIIGGKTQTGAKLVSSMAAFFLKSGFLRRFSDSKTNKMPLGHLIVARKPG